MEGPGVVHKPHACTNCKAAFSRMADLKRHLCIHTDQKPYKCTYCNSAFVLKRNLRIHTRMHTREKTHRCTLCNAAFSDKGNMKRHMQTHTGERPHQCEYCSAAFQQKWHLKVHIMTHTGEKPHKCELCSASFTDKGNLKSHIRTHSNEKPHKCSFCDATFSRKWNLKSHIMSHTGEKKHNCPHCEAAFLHAGDLKRHIMTHTKEKPYKCLCCGLAFTRKGGLKIHTMIHTGEKPHKCSLCNAAFTVKASLRNHIKTHSGKKSQKVKNRNPPHDRQSKACVKDKTKINSASDLDTDKRNIDSDSFTQVSEKTQKCGHGCFGCTENFHYTNAHCDEESLRYKADTVSIEGKLKSNSNYSCKNTAVGGNCYAMCTDVERVKNHCTHSKEDHLKCNFIDTVFTNDKVERDAYPHVGSHNFELSDTGLKDNGNLKDHINTHSSGHMCKICDTDVAFQSTKEPFECKVPNVCKNPRNSHMSCHFKETLSCEIVDAVSTNKGRQKCYGRNNNKFSGTGKCNSAKLNVKQDMNDKCCRAIDSHKGLNSYILTHDEGTSMFHERELPCQALDEKTNNEGNISDHITGNPIENKELSDCNACHIEILGSDETETLNSQKDIETLREYKYCNTDLMDKEKIKIHISTSVEDLQRSRIGDTQYYYSEGNEKILVCTDFEKPHRCEICSAEFSKEFILKNNSCTPPQVELHKCTVGNAAFSDLEQVASYVGIHCENQKFGNVDFAGEERQSQLSTNYNEEHSRKICGAILSGEENFASQSDPHPDENVQRCKVCDATFTDKRSIRNHIRAHFNGKPHRCAKCDLVFIHKENLEEHMYDQSKEIFCKCKLCDFVHAGKEKTSNHLISHFTEKPHFDLEGREKSGHHVVTERSELFTHEQCCGIFLDQGPLMIQKGIHNASGSQCTIPYSQAGENSSAECIGTGFGSRSLNCTLCDAAFLVKGTTNHIRIHTGSITNEVPLSDMAWVERGRYCIRIYTKDQAHGLAMCRAK